VPFNVTDAWGTSTISYSYSNFLDGSLMVSDGTTGDLPLIAQEAMGAWTSIAAIAFYAQTDSGPAPSDDEYVRKSHPTIRWGHHFIDGQPAPGQLSTLAHGNYPGGNGIAGDIHFDSGESFSIDRALETAVHEIGHTLGMKHANGDVENGVPPPPFPAIMHAALGGGGTWNYSGLGTAYLLPDDIAGIRSLYGAGLGYVLDYRGVMHVYGTRGDDSFIINTIGNDIVVTNVGVGTMQRTKNGVREVWVHGQDGNDIFQVFRTDLAAVNISGDRGNDTVRVEQDPGTNVFVRGGPDGDQVWADITARSAILGGNYLTMGKNTLYYNASGDTEQFTIKGDERSTLKIVDTPTAISGVSDIGTVNIQRMTKPFSVTRPRNVLIGGGGGTGGISGSIRISSNGYVGLTVDDSFGEVPRDITIGRDFILGFPGSVSWDSNVIFNNFQIFGGRGANAITDGNRFTIQGTPSATVNLNSGIRGDEVFVLATSGPVNINGQDGFDSVNIGRAGQTRDIGGLLTITNPKKLTAVIVDDSADPTPRTGILYRDSNTGFNILSGLGGDIVLRGRDLSGLSIRAGNAGNQFRIHDTPTSNKLGNITTRISTGNGSDAVLVTGTTGSLAIDGQNGADNVTFGRDGRVQNIRGAVTLTNALGTNAVNLDNSADPNSRTMILYKRTEDNMHVISGLGDIVLRGDDLRSLTLAMGSDGNFFRVHDTPFSSKVTKLTTTIRTGNGWDTIAVNGTSGALALELGGGLNDVTLGSKTTGLDRIQGIINVGGPGGTNNVTIHDRPTTADRELTHTITPASYNRIGSALVSFSDLRNFDVLAGDAADSFDVSGLAGATLPHTVYIDGGAGTNTLDYSRGPAEPPVDPPQRLSWYRAEGDFTDAAGGNHGTPQNGVSFADGRVGQAFSFDGVDDYIDLGSDPSLDIPGSVTVAAWINYQAYDNGTGYKYLFADFDAGGTVSQGAIGLLGAQMFWHQSMTDGTSIEPTGTTIMQPGQWYHLAAVRDNVAKTVKLYVNGVEDASENYVGDVVGLQSSKVLGTSLPEGFPNDFFPGLIDETSIFNSALSAAEIQGLFREGGGTVSGPDVVVNLVERTATGVTGGIRRIQNAIGGAGNDVLVGNGGNVLSGGGGRDLLIAGDAASQLFGGDDEDLLIGGRTIYDSNEATLADIMAEWTASTPYETRVQNLRDGILNDAIRPNGRQNTLYGQDGRDFFYASALDLTDGSSDEVFA
jgi:hypothetical protein